MRPFACSYTSRQKTASHVIHYSRYHLRLHSRRPPPHFRGPSTARRLLQSAPATALCLRSYLTPWRDKQKAPPRIHGPALASYKPRATSYASRVASIARRALTASPIVYVSIPCARNSSESSSHERYPTAMITVSKPRNS